jgi:TonB family protein
MGLNVAAPALGEKIMRMRRSTLLFALAVAATTCAFAQDQPKPTEGISAPAPQQQVENIPRIRIAGKVAAAKITHMVQPVYPQSAKTAKISGTVVLHCIIAKDGTMSQVQYISGPPLLMRAAMDAVRQWTYQPTTLNGSPVEVDTVVSVVFTLGGNPSVDTRAHDDSTAPPQNQKSVTIAVGAPPIDPQFKADIQHLIELTHFKEKQEEAMREILNSIRPTLLATIPTTPNREKILNTYIDKLVSLLQSDDFRNRLIAAYAQNLTDDDVKAASAFYETPAGQHYLEGSVKMAPEVMMIGQQFTKDNVPAILRDLCEEYPELRDDAKFCGPPEPTRKSLLPSLNPLPTGN